MVTRWMKIKLVAATLPLLAFGLGGVARNAYETNQSPIQVVVDGKDLTHESLNKSILQPQGGGICNGCVVRFIDTHGK